MPRSPTSQSKSQSPRRSRTPDPKELRGFLIRLQLMPRSPAFDQQRPRYGLSPLGKAATAAWSDLDSQEGIRPGSLLLRGGELHGMLFLKGPAADRRLSLALRLVKTRVAKAAEKAGLAPVAWRKAYQATPFNAPADIIAARRRLAKLAREARKKP